ncbi:hypothetical protein [Actinotalea soli]|nr:hypothetical protein [Actinotalea soli]
MPERGATYAEATHTAEAAALMVRTLREAMGCSEPADARVATVAG